jgi:hypothetical protein
LGKVLTERPEHVLLLQLVLSILAVAVGPVAQLEQILLAILHTLLEVPAVVMVAAAVAVHLVLQAPVEQYALSGLDRSVNFHQLM